MHSLEKAMEIYNAKVQEDSNYAQKIVNDWKERMPDDFIRYMYEQEYGCHIIDRGMYDKAVSYFKWAGDKGDGARWSVEDAVKASEINFDEMPFYELDYAYVLNMLNSDYCNVFTDTSYYLKMAKNYLTDPDYPGEADERAYKDAKKRIKYFEEE